MLSNARASDSGNYSCIASNQVGTSTVTTYITILDPSGRWGAEHHLKYRKGAGVSLKPYLGAGHLVIGSFALYKHAPLGLYPDKQVWLSEWIIFVYCFALWALATLGLLLMFYCRWKLSKEPKAPLDGDGG